MQRYDVKREISSANVPVVINCRDRLQPLRRLIEWLEQAGHQRIVLLDNNSSYPPLLDYLGASPHEVVRLAYNAGPRAPWISGHVDRLQAKWYVATDPDVVPTEDCPLDVVCVMHDVLMKHRRFSKVGLGLKLDDLPDHYQFAREVRIIESEYYQPERKLAEHIYRSPVDTTFALYRGGRPFTIDHALRLDHPYTARHLPWYENSEEPSAEERYYQSHAEGDWNTWRLQRLPDWLLPHVERVTRGDLLPPPSDLRMTALARYAVGRFARLTILRQRRAANGRTPDG